ncbi:MULTISPECIES: GGDEF domain-containing protein [unclassified Fusibacter]|uniref:GGDEF domain-containing protein n=1 Tax=unclassified Fusibacter TaxID=2624464 RepID=UPI001012962A|nr:MULTISPECIES: GGDEF domain-containing protein [unclassified Fusibacter]MCK8058390.1 GGDEF domain-containing protein [Fusibacter sp. A2]NPE20973.1 GGDEF domain-containing protein [Fusibacter sp. A1]RXV63173.1 GGDEF domain-containing protein [Fusibacter sp. A1]
MLVTNEPTIDSRTGLFHSILIEESVTTFYQPIVSLKTANVMGYEALSRGPQNTEFYSPIEMIKAAHEHDKLWELEMLFRQKALERAKEISPEKYLFINVDPDIIKSSDFKTGLTKECLDEMEISEKSIVFEITERTSINDYVSFQIVLEHYRNQGYKIAIDDVGAGYSGLKTINEVRPDFIKIDMDLIRNIDKDAFKQALLKAFVDTAVKTNIMLIAEGIETKEELKTLIMLGVHAGQGYYLQKPSPKFEDLEPEVVKRIEDYNKISNNLNSYAQDYHYISNLVYGHKHCTFESMIESKTVKQHLEKENLTSACICEHDYPVGLLMKHNIDSKLSGRYGYSLYSNRPVSKVMNANPLIVDSYTPISVVAKRAMERSDDEIFDDIIVTKSSKYYGIVSMKKIFEYTLMFEKNNAKEHNPLSGLPGNPIIKRVMSDFVTYKNNSCICYLDINDFKIYNDVYGFESGDNMIRFLAQLIQDNVKKIFPSSSFIGHVGGDDFIIIINGVSEEYHQVLQNILDDFEKNKVFLFSDKHIMNNKIVSEDRFGVMREFPLTKLAIAGIAGDLSKYRSSDYLSEALAGLKKEVKQTSDSSYKIIMKY